MIDEQFFYGGPFKEIVKAAVKEALAEEEGEEGPEIDIKTCLECDNTFIVCPLDMDDEPMDEPMDPGFCPFCGEAL